MTEPLSFMSLSTSFLDALESLIAVPEGQWWLDVLAHPDLILAVRNESLNVYHRGASLFRVTSRQGRPIPASHVKYLVRRRQALAELGPMNTFGFEAKDVLWHNYAGPETLADMIQAANALTGPEKSLLHPLIQASPNMVDVEIAVTGEANDDDEPAGSAALLDDTAGSPSGKGKLLRQDRIDVASLEARGDPKRAWLVFHEAKHFTNPALRSAPKRRPEVPNQLARYRSSIGGNSGSFGVKYPLVCHNLVRLDAMRRKVRDGHPLWVGKMQRELDPVIREVATGERTVIDTIPRLVIFGFDADQRDGALSTIRDRLEQEFDTPVYAVGNPKGSKTTPAFQPSRAVLDAHAKIMADEAIEAAKPPPPPPPAVITAPADAPERLSLLFDTPVAGVHPVYLVNAGPAPLGAVVVTIGSPTGDPTSPLTTSKLEANDGTVLAGTGVLIDRYGIFWDGDVLTSYQIDYFEPDGVGWRAQAFVGKGGAPGRWVKLKTVAVETPAVPSKGEAPL